MKPTPEAADMAAYLRENIDDDAAWLVYADMLEDTHPHFAQHVRATRGIPLNEQVTALEGALVRTPDGRFRWRDEEEPDPRIRGLTINTHGFLIEFGHVMVPIAVLSGRRGVGNIELRFVAEGNDLLWFKLELSGPRRVAVPLREWDAHAAALPAGIEWDRRHEEEILRRARMLGWQGRGRLNRRGGFTV